MGGQGTAPTFKPEAKESAERCNLCSQFGLGGDVYNKECIHNLEIPITLGNDIDDNAGGVNLVSEVE